MPAVLVLAEPASVSAGPLANVVAPSTATAPSAATIPATRTLCTDTDIPSRVGLRDRPATRPRSVAVTVGTGPRIPGNGLVKIWSRTRKPPTAVPWAGDRARRAQLSRPGRAPALRGRGAARRRAHRRVARAAARDASRP